MLSLVWLVMVLRLRLLVVVMMMVLLLLMGERTLLMVMVRVVEKILGDSLNKGGMCQFRTIPYTECTCAEVVRHKLACLFHPRVVLVR